MQAGPSTSQGGQLSPDGLYRWDGVRWIPTAGVAPPAAMAVQVERVSAPGSRLAIAGGVVSIVGAVAIIAACILPYAKMTDPSAAQSALSIFNAGFSGGLWYAAEPVAVILVSLTAGVLLIALRHRLIRALATGALIAFGVQTFFLFVGYVGASATGSGEQAGLGGIIGVLAALAIIVGGALGAASLSSKPTPTTT
jgi:hypothetical protein